MHETEPLVVDKHPNHSFGSFIHVVIICLVLIVLFCLGKQHLTEKQSHLLTTSHTTNDAQRILIYYSPSEEESNNLDLMELIDEDNLNPTTNAPYITHIEISTLHLKQHDDDQWQIHLNDLTPDDARFIKLRQNIPKLQAHGVKVLFMMGGWEGIGGEAPYSDSSFVNLFTEWNSFYPQLVELIQLWSIDGLDIDIENCYDDDYNLIHDNYDNVIKLITRLRSDFGVDFIIALSPVAEALFMDDTYGGLSGFNYKELVLESKYGPMVNQLNVQFYDGWGTLKEYDQCVDVQGYKASMLVAGMLNADEGDISNTVQITITRLNNKYGDTFGGVSVYYGNAPHIVKWSKNMYHLLHL